MCICIKFILLYYVILYIKIFDIKFSVEFIIFVKFLSVLFEFIIFGEILNLDIDKFLLWF